MSAQSSDKITIDLQAEAAQYEAMGFKPRDKNDLIDYAAEVPISTHDLAVIGTIADLRGDSEARIFGDPKVSLLMGNKFRLRQLVSTKRRKVKTASGQEVEVRAYDMPTRPQVTIKQGDPDGEGIYESAVQGVADDNQPERALLPSDDPVAVKSAVKYIRRNVVGQFEERLYRLSAYGESDQANQLCDWLIKEVERVRNSL